MARVRPVGDWIADRYEIFAVYKGGMGVVYVAHDHLGPPGREVVAIKTLRDEWLAQEDWSARFAAECQIWVQLGSHRNIVHANSVETFDGRPHIVLELVNGGDLKRRIGTPELDLKHALHLGIQFCLGMEHAVRQGLRCHRDVKPGNLMVAGDGTLKITDFGLAVIRDERCAGPAPEIELVPDEVIPLDEVTLPGRITYDDPADRPPPFADDFQGADAAAQTVAFPRHGGPTPGGEATLRITQTGSLMGTILYMAPEQFRDAKAVDIRADIYAFGVVLFEMLTGKLPFRGGTIARLDRAHAHYAPPSVVPSIPRKHAREARAIDEIVQRCLRKDPADRFASMKDFRRALTRTLRRIDPGFDPYSG
jgi:serine/threonine protein kinase